MTQLSTRNMAAKLSWLDDRERGNEHQVVCLRKAAPTWYRDIYCIYFNPQIERFWCGDYRIYDPDGDKKT